MKALISPQENNRICEVVAQDFPIAEPLYWVNCPDTCTTEWVFTGSEFNPPVVPEPTPEEIIKQYTDAIQTHLDAFAQTRGYDGILSACTYVTSTVAKFAAEGQYCVEARDTTWDASYQIMADVLAGIRPPPTLEQLFADLPALDWPA